MSMEEYLAQAVEGTLEGKEAAEDTPEAEEASGAADVDIDDDYVANATATQGTWDPWPTPAQD